MREYLQSTGYLILRWAEPSEDGLTYEVVTPWGEVVRTECEWLLVPQAPPVWLPLAA